MRSKTDFKWGFVVTLLAFIISIFNQCINMRAGTVERKRKKILKWREYKAKTRGVKNRAELKPNR